jgi:hypothetical protein
MRRGVRPGACSRLEPKPSASVHDRGAIVRRATGVMCSTSYNSAKRVFARGRE